jgi:indolepyruvate decarboxylase
VLTFAAIAEALGTLPLIELSHEPAVAFAADGAARARLCEGGGAVLGVCLATYGPGALNLLSAVACAYVERSPLVVISGYPGRGEIARG